MENARVILFYEALNIFSILRALLRRELPRGLGRRPLLPRSLQSDGQTAAAKFVHHNTFKCFKTDSPVCRYTGYIRGMGETFAKTPVMAQVRRHLLSCNTLWLQRWSNFEAQLR